MESCGALLLILCVVVIRLSSTEGGEALEDPDEIEEDEEEREEEEEEEEERELEEEESEGEQYNVEYVEVCIDIAAS
jgi:hypothetical protein